MLIAGIDVGMRNLGVCIIDVDKWRNNEKSIVLWQNIDVLDPAHTCISTIKTGKNKGKTCSSQASWVSEDSFFCNRHKPKDLNCLPYYSDNCKNTKAIDIKRNAFLKLDKIHLFSSVSYIIIENQPKFNQKMKMFASSIESYFILRLQVDNKTPLKDIIYSQPRNKLKVYNGPLCPISSSVHSSKKKYKTTKETAIEHTKAIISQRPFEDTSNFYSASKKDDMADAFLHCLYNINNKL